jgi:signal transduction histidine kinase
MSDSTGTPVTEQKSPLHWLQRGGEMSQLIAAKAWAETPLGPIESWPASLLTTVSLCLASNFPINIIWGPSHLQIYNDGYRVVCGAAHPRALGEAYNVTWASAWPAIGKPFERALAGETSFLENQRMFLERNGYPEETFFTFSLSPIRDESGAVVGLFHPVTETTAAMLSERRIRALRDLAERAGKAKTVAEASALALQSLSDYPRDLPLGLLYLVDSDGRAKLEGCRGVEAGSPAAPRSLAIDAAAWPFAEAAASLKCVRVKDVQARFGEVVCGEYPEALREALVLPFADAGSGRVMGFIVAGLSTRLPLDEAYSGFVTMLGNAVGAALNNARAYEEEKRRAEALAEIDRAKTAFFSNVSHEFRTPLTLMLGPLEDLLAGGQLAPSAKTEVEVVHRNALRLLKLVNALLDFSRIEANRVEAAHEVVELSVLTTDLASAFRASIERAGMKLRIDAPPLNERVHVDREMWEKIVLNLVSNAFKYTLQGEIEVTLKPIGQMIELAVRDTGTGIPAGELPRVFQRFHRVQGAQGRTHEGTGIGLALVQELAKLHGGSVRVESKVGEGSTFTVSIPRGTAHLPQQRAAAQGQPSASSRPDSFVEEAARWNTKEMVPAPPRKLTGRKQILLADDNADMRDYVARLLSNEYDVIAVADGKQALEHARSSRPHLLLSDIMMPVMDGLELLTAIRADASLKTLPVVLLSARAGEEAKAGGIDSGADDYLTKPFSARELLARIRMQLHMSEVRQSAIEQEVRAAALARVIQARDEFLSIASHELKTPLTSLKMQLQLTQKSIRPAEGIAPQPAKLAQVFDLSIRQVQRLGKLVEELLDVSRMHAGRMLYRLEEVELSGLVAETIERFADQLEAARCPVQVSAPDKLLMSCDRFRVEQVLTNLLTNAMKYGAGMPIRVSVSPIEGGARIEVTDEGMGIAPEKHARIFDRFERAISHHSISGLGLGLFIARQIVEAHGGSIGLRSEVGKGSTFTVQLPFEPPPMVTAPAEERLLQ